jgi:general secretion pathway protein L
VRTLVLFDGEPGHWLRIEDDTIIARGARPVDVDPGDARVVGIVPGRDTIVHALAVTGLTEAQARGAARLAMAETSVVPVDTLHVAVGPEADGARETVAIDAARMAQRLVDLAAQGFDPDALIPAVLIAPPPAAGFVRALLGDETVVRGEGAAFTDDPVLTPLLAPGPIDTLDRDETEAAIVAAVAKPKVNLRQGSFAKRQRWVPDRARLRTILWLAAACLATLLLVPLATLVNLTMTARAIEARNIERAQAVLPASTVVVNPVAQLDERLGLTGLQNGGFLPLAGAVAKAVEAVPGVEIERLVYTGAEGLRVGVRAPNTGDYQLLVAKLTASGLAVGEGGTPAAREILVTRP